MHTISLFGGVNTNPYYSSSFPGPRGLLLLNERMLPEFLSRGLVIVARVARWRPAELLLYDHLPLRKQRLLALHFATLRFEILR